MATVMATTVAIRVFIKNPLSNMLPFLKRFSIADPWLIISHGDCWSGNMMFRYDPVTSTPIEVILFDLQMSQEVSAVNDLQHVTALCTTAAFRDAHTLELLRLYHDRLATFNMTYNLTLRYICEFRDCLSVRALLTKGSPIWLKFCVGVHLGPSTFERKNGCGQTNPTYIQL